MNYIPSKNKVILPLDGMDWDDALSMIELTSDLVWGYKINDLLLKYGVQVIKEIKSKGHNVMADPKLFDIPNTMDNSIKELVSAGADIITVHAAADYYSKEYASYLAGVTILTSMQAESCEVIYGDSIRDTVMDLAHRANHKGYGYIVCSADELSMLKDIKITKIVPGIRPKHYNRRDDQVRVSTPRQAIEYGAGLLVIGRPITSAVNVRDAIKQINEEIEGG